MLWKVVRLFSFSISSGVSFSLEKIVLSMAASILFLPQKEVRAQALRRVSWMSRSHRLKGMPASWARRTAVSISSPGETPRLAPRRRWKEESTRLASSRKPLRLRSTSMMFSFCQPPGSVSEL